MDDTERARVTQRDRQLNEEERRLQEHAQRIRDGLETPSAGLGQARGSLQQVARYLDGIARTGAALDGVGERTSLAALLLDALSVAKALVSREGRGVEADLWLRVRERMAELRAAVEGAEGGRPDGGG